MILVLSAPAWATASVSCSMDITAEHSQHEMGGSDHNMSGDHQTMDMTEHSSMPCCETDQSCADMSCMSLLSMSVVGILGNFSSDSMINQSSSIDIYSSLAVIGVSQSLYRPPA